MRRNKNYTTIILEDFTDQELLIVGKQSEFYRKGNASTVKASKVAVEKYFDSLEESAKVIFNGKLVAL
ncbi:hypothetical protein N8D25_13840 (plasmid) [Enterococcus faecium]